MARVDELTLSLTASDEQRWALGLVARDEEGMDLGPIVGSLLKHTTGLTPPPLPTVRVHEIGVKHGPDGTEVSSEIRLPESFHIKLSQLPLVGKHVDAMDRLQFETLGVALTHTPTGGWDRRFSGKLLIGREELDLKLPLRTSGEPRPDPQQLPRPTTFGPLTIDGLDLDVHEERLRVRLNARIGRGRVAIDVIGLQAAVNLATPTDTHVSVDGLAVRYALPPVTISGGMLIVDEAPPRRFDGSLAVRAGAYGLSAIGSYADSDTPSLFAFLELLLPIGGPPHFYVNRIAGGFGLNRELIVPPIEALGEFPLLVDFDDWSPARPRESVDRALAGIDRHLGPHGGGHWLAAGVGFASFGIVQTMALLTLAFRGRVEIGVLGHATLAFPATEHKVVDARMALRTVVSPGVGEFSARGQLAPGSYVLDRDCRLTGGFAACLWFGPHAHAGDFVVTLGGYHPAFEAPAHYPAVPRLGVTWAPAGIPLKLRGAQYFALTPGLVMIGGALEANWDKGPLRARFAIQADFLVEWAPFHYETTLGVTFSLEVSLGSRLKHTISANVAAELQLWGPRFSGKARIEFGVMSFAIEFGSDAPQRPDPLTWPEFEHQLLGPRDTLLRLRVRDGLLAELGEDSYLVDAEHFVAESELRVPASHVIRDGHAPEARAFDIAPLGLRAGEFQSRHGIRVERRSGDDWTACPTFVSELVTEARLPKGLWQHQNDLAAASTGDATRVRAALAAEGTVKDLVTGVRLAPATAPAPAELTVPIDELTVGIAPAAPWRFEAPKLRARAGKPSGSDALQTIADTITAPAVAEARARIVSELLDERVASSINVTALARRDGLRLRAAPRTASIMER